jgi:hypothetical protein
MGAHSHRDAPPFCTPRCGTYDPGSPLRARRFADVEDLEAFPAADLHENRLVQRASALRTRGTFLTELAASGTSPALLPSASAIDLEGSGANPGLLLFARPLPFVSPSTSTGEFPSGDGDGDIPTDPRGHQQRGTCTPILCDSGSGIHPSGMSLPCALGGSRKGAFLGRSRNGQYFGCLPGQARRFPAYPRDPKPLAPCRPFLCFRPLQDFRALRRQDLLVRRVPVS